MTHITTLANIKSLEDRYPFIEEELEVLVRFHDQLNKNENNKDDFLVTLAKAVPYSAFFLPGDEMKDRVNWLEDHILCMGFSSRLRCAITTDSFVDYANQGQGKALERLIEGIADTGRRGNQEALRVTYDILDEDATPNDLVELCISMVIAADALVVPNLDKRATYKRLRDAEPCILSMARSLTEYCENEDEDLCKRNFIAWVEAKFPGLASTLSTFTHNLLFHGHPYPKTRVPYIAPEVSGASNIFRTHTSPLMLALSFTHAGLGGKWHQLYSSNGDEGRSFNRIEWSLLGYTGPTMTVVKTTSNAVLGAYTSMPWKENMDFIGDSESYLFQLRPRLNIYHAEGLEENFAYLHSGGKSTLSLELDIGHVPSGLGFGGSLERPRLFIPESLEHCQARFFDKTYQVGELLPMDELEMFEIAAVEIWAVGGTEMINKALQDRTEYIARHEAYLLSARVVHDKSQFVADFESGLIPNTLYGHKHQVRGNQDFVVDEEHDGYKVERE